MFFYGDIEMKKTNLLMLAAVIAVFALGIAAQDAKAVFDKGLGQFAAKQYAEAITSFQQYITMRPNDASADYNIALCYYNMERYQDSVPSFKEAIRKKPDYASAYVQLGN